MKVSVGFPGPEEGGGGGGDGEGEADDSVAAVTIY